MIVKAYLPRMTPEQFEKLPDSQGLELIDGVVKEKNMGTENGSIQTLISYYLNLVVVPGKLGRVVDSEGMYQCFPSSPKQVRKPDVSFILPKRELCSFIKPMARLGVSAKPMTSLPIR